MRGIGEFLARAATGLVWLVAAAAGLVVLVVTAPFIFLGKLFQRSANSR